jgi:hypothetical protein
LLVWPELVSHIGGNWHRPIGTDAGSKIERFHAATSQWLGWVMNSALPRRPVFATPSL